MNSEGIKSIPHGRGSGRHALIRLCLLCVPFLLGAGPLQANDSSAEADYREQFKTAWASARSGNREDFERLGPGLTDYVLYPYWQYEDFRHRRSQVAPATMASFLETHENWAFAAPLRTAWLKTLGKNKRWQALRLYGEGVSNTEVRCYLAQAKLSSGQTEGLMSEARELWTVGKSQPDACDPLFKWFVNQGGVTRDLAWERISLAMASGNSRLTIYLGRFLPLPEREWLDRWQRFDQSGYRMLDRATSWSDTELTRMIAEASLRRLARLDPERAMELYDPLANHFDWPASVEGDLMREIALWSAVGLEDNVIDFIHRVPEASRNDQLQEWWARVALVDADWEEVIKAINGMSAETFNDDRWQYWLAQAEIAGGLQAAESEVLQTLASRTSYYGFLSADALDLPYTICPADPPVTDEQIENLANSDRFYRALELHEVELDSWARTEWARAAAELPADELKVAAGLARREGWHDRVIFALGDSGELSFYEWRFPIIYTDPIMKGAGAHDLDPAYVLGIMRSESAMMETARSSANALGLMQVTPATAKMLSRKHGMIYQSSAELLEGDRNIAFGTVLLRDLLDDYDQNPVLVSAAYNAGPTPVARWLADRDVDDAARWIETLPYYETRDYIPRVLAFTTLYDWRLQNPVRRISTRMPGIESGTIEDRSTVEVVCRPIPGDVTETGP